MLIEHQMFCASGSEQTLVNQLQKNSPLSHLIHLIGVVGQKGHLPNEILVALFCWPTMESWYITPPIEEGARWESDRPLPSLGAQQGHEPNRDEWEWRPDPIDPFQVV